MTQTVHAKVYSGIDIVASTPNDLGIDTYRAPADLTPRDYANGLVNKFFTDTRSLSASGSENLDLAGGLTDGQGNTLTFTYVKAIEIIADAANTNNVLVGGAGSNTFVLFSDTTDILPVKPGGRLLIDAPDGYAVTAGTGDILKIANSSSGSSVAYKIRIIGLG